MTQPLFDCSPRIAAKLARCNEIARVQLERTRKYPLGGDCTVEDFCILAGRRRGTRYFLSLNA